MSNEASAWDPTGCGPITILSVTYDIDGQLYQNVISGPELETDCLLEEGVYVLCQNRGIQIASFCDRRMCDVSKICYCAEREDHQANLDSSDESRSEDTRKKMEKTLRKWLHLDEAAVEVTVKGLCFLAHPRTLSWDNMFDNTTFHFDHEREEYRTSKNLYARSTEDLFAVKENVEECPDGVIEFIYDQWRYFLQRGGYSLEPAKATPSERGSDNDSDGETPRPKSSSTETKSPLLKKVFQMSRLAKEGVKQHLPSRPILTPPQSANSTNSNSSIEAISDLDLNEGSPAPVITPPKNMRVGHIFRHGNGDARL
ncbi:hypothetical protein F5Y09DRAFT_340633 [Xylaria sp. FL1042]|nr:hypothetical protein F5Y09DRAFT_340633 [Xylaria sp. FL1042]